MTSELAERKLSLFEIEQSLAMLMQDRDEVTDPEEIAAVDAAIRDYVSQKIRKVDGIRGYIRNEEVAAAAATDEARRANAIASVHLARIDRLKASCLMVMQEMGERRLDGTAGYLIVKGNGGLAPLKIQDDVLPDEYRDVTVQMPVPVWNYMRNLAQVVNCVNEVREGQRATANGRIREALKDGAVPGAWLEERGSHLECK